MRHLTDIHTNLGAIVGSMNGHSVVRHYGDPSGEYQSAMTRAIVVDNSHMGLLRVHGRAPRQMLQGILTNSVPDPPIATDDSRSVLRGGSVYATILTPKGRMVSDMQVAWLGEDEEVGVLLSLPASGLEASKEYFTKYIPPRLAKVVEIGAEVGLLTVAGPNVTQVLWHAVEGLSEGFEEHVPQGGYVVLDGGPLDGGVLVARNHTLGLVEAWDVYSASDSLTAVWAELVKAEARPSGLGVWDTLRVEAGSPAYGVDMTDATIPIEAGIGDLAFDHDKGCYTGQEVIIRIRHRGRVNWHLRSLRFGEHSPVQGDELFMAGEAKVVGRVTSSVQSPRFGQVIGLGYVRREVEPPASLRIGNGDGPEVVIELLPGSPSAKARTSGATTQGGK